MWPARRVYHLALWLVSFALALAASTAWHLPIPAGRRAAATLANVLISDLIVGELRIGRITRIGLDGIVARDVELFDREGTRVIVAHRILLILDPYAALRSGTLRFSHASLDRATLRLEPREDGSLSFLDALGAADTTPSAGGGSPFHAIVDDMRLQHVEAYGELLGARGLHARDVSAHMRMEFHGDVDIRVFGGSGTIDGPMDFDGELDDITAHISSDPYLGTRLHARTHYGDERMRANLSYAVPRGRPPESPSELDLMLHADPVDLRTVGRMGFTWAEPFVGLARGYVRLHGPPAALALDAHLVHEGGPITLDGLLSSEEGTTIHARTPGMDLSRLVADSPPVPLGGELTLRLAPGTSEAPPVVDAHIEAFVFEGFRIPTLDARATLEEDHVRIETVDGDYGRGGRLHVEGTAGYDGSLHLRVRGSLGDVAHDPNVQSLAASAGGRTRVDATIDHENGRTTIRGTGTVTGARYGDVSANQLSFAVQSRTENGATTYSTQVDTVDLRLGSIMLGDGRASIASRGDGLRASGTFHDPRVAGTMEVGVDLTTQGARQTLRNTRLRYARRGVEVIVTAERLEFEPHVGLVADQVLVTLDGNRALALDARWRARGSDRATAVLGPVDLERVSRLLHPLLPDLRGTLTGGGLLQGDLETNPTLKLEAQIADASVRTLEGLAADLVLELENGNVVGKFDIDAGESGRAHINLSGASRITLPNFSTALREGEYDFRAGLEEVDVGRVAAGLLGMRDAGIEGCMDGSMRFGGFLAFAPTFDANLELGHLEFGGLPPLAAAMVSRYDGQSLETTATLGTDEPARPGRARCVDHDATSIATDSAFAARGLAELYASIQAPLLELFGSELPMSSLLEVLPWTMSARVPPKRVSTLPTAFRSLLPTALGDFQLAGSLSALGGFGPIQASLTASADWVGDSSSLVCARDAHPRFSLSGTHVGGETRATVTGFAGPSRFLSALITTALPIDEWMRTGVIAQMPPTNIDAALTTVDLASVGRDAPPVEASSLPYLCQYFVGPVGGRFAIDQLFTDAPTISGALTSEALRFRRIERTSRGTIRTALAETPPIPEIALKFAGDHDRLEFNHDMRWWLDDAVTQVTGHVDWSWNAVDFIPVVAEDAAFSVDVDAPLAATGTDERAETTFPLQMLAGWLPIFGSVDGSMRVRAHAGGTLLAPTFGGTMRISDGTLVLTGIGQRLRNVTGTFELEGQRILVRSLRARDGDGSVTVNGDIGMVAFTPQDFRLRLEADAFPVRDEGSIIARLRGHAALEGTLGESSIDSTLTIQDLDVALTPPSSQSPIGLREHPDVQLVGLETRAMSEEEPYPVGIHIEQTPRFWVRSEDFAAQVSTELRIRYASPHIHILGSLELHRGFFEVMGKRFEVTRGSMVFNGAEELNPQVSLVAVHRLRGGGDNDIITVRASGTLASPTIEFTSPLVASGDQGQILSLLLTGRLNGQRDQTAGSASSTTVDAQDQALSFLTGVAFGVATLALREQFGEFIPMLAVETGASGSLPRIRAGFNMDRIIPERLRRIVRGIYIEGYVNTDTFGSDVTTAAANASSFGVAIEVQFPRNIVSHGEVGESNSWRFNVTWEP